MALENISQRKMSGDKIQVGASCWESAAQLQLVRQCQLGRVAFSNLRKNWMSQPILPSSSTTCQRCVGFSPLSLPQYCSSLPSGGSTGCTLTVNCWKISQSYLWHSFVVWWWFYNLSSNLTSFKLWWFWRPPGILTRSVIKPTIMPLRSSSLVKLYEANVKCVLP